MYVCTSAVVVAGLLSSAQATGWEYGKLWQVYEVGPQGSDWVTYWQEGTTVTGEGQDFAELYSRLGGVPKNLSNPGEASEMDLLTLLGSRGWELAAFNSYDSLEAPVTRMDVWYFKRPLKEQR